VRVEQELARRARRLLGDDVAFCVYERALNRFLILSDEIASDILVGRLQVNFAAEPAPPPQPSFLAALRARVRRAIRTNVTLYQAFQRVRGRQYTRDEIIQIQQLEFGGPETRTPAKRIEFLSRIAPETAKLDAATCIISCGLDWQYKDLRDIWALKQSRGFRYVPVVHDLIPLSFPHFVTPGYDTLVADYFGELIWVADCAMCNSQSTRRDWLRYCAETGVDIPADAFSLGCDLPAAPLESELPSSLTGKLFALFVSTIEPRKNHRLLYDAWDRCIRSGTVDAARDRLVFVGRVGWAVDDLMRELSANPATRDSIVVLNEVNDDLLATLYRECAFILFPSFWEGYGLPVAEALAYSKPCISSDAGSLSEIGGDLVLRIDPKDTLTWADRIAHYFAHPDELEDWSRRIKATHQPVTWDASALQFFSTIKDARS
jgi:glycosyltransferase involved in cell wall biosynthesis